MTDTESLPVEPERFESHPDLESACKYAATLAAYPCDLSRGFVPAEDEPTGTVTFLEIEGKTYALTAKHVVDVLNDRCMKLGIPEGSFFAPKDPGLQIQGPFLVPPRNAAARSDPDVALRPVDSRLPGHIGKGAFVVSQSNCAPQGFLHGRAVGFPSMLKKDTEDNGSMYSAMQCVHAIAKRVHQSADQTIFRSEIPKPYDIASLSGMSGGPVFWSDEHNFGIAGIIIESIDPAPGSFFDAPMVHFIAHSLDYETLVSWAQFADANWKIEREKLCERAAKNTRFV